MAQGMLPLSAKSGQQDGHSGPGRGREGHMYNVFYIIGVVVVVLAILGYLGFR